MFECCVSGNAGVVGTCIDLVLIQLGPEVGPAAAVALTKCVAKVFVGMEKLLQLALGQPKSKNQCDKM